MLAFSRCKLQKGFNADVERAEQNLKIKTLGTVSNHPVAIQNI